MIRFRFNAEKAYRTVLWMLGETPALDLRAVLKACYFADKSHLNEFGRPGFGALYRAMKYGPVPLEIYEMLKGEPLWLYETEQDAFPWRVRGRGRIESVRAPPQPNLGIMDYAAMIEDGPDRDERVEELRGIASRMVI